jgi:beta-glucanase (GH16 family)
VLQSRESAEAGYDASKTGNFIRANLSFDPTIAFHEYRIDYLPNQVVFYADNQPIAQMNGTAIPSTAGHLILQHWSNGNQLWSGGPPAWDSSLTVKYVKAYFNSSSSQRQSDWSARCKNPKAPGAICHIPDTSSGDSSTDDWFFTDHTNMIHNQTVSATAKKKNLGIATKHSSFLALVCIVNMMRLVVS